VYVSTITLLFEVNCKATYFDYRSFTLRPVFSIVSQAHSILWHSWQNRPEDDKSIVETFSLIITLINKVIVLMYTFWHSITLQAHHDVSIQSCSQAKCIYLYMNLRTKDQRCCANIYFNQRCLKHSVIPKYEIWCIPWMYTRWDPKVCIASCDTIEKNCHEDDWSIVETYSLIITLSNKVFILYYVTSISWCFHSKNSVVSLGPCSLFPYSAGLRTYQHNCKDTRISHNGYEKQWNKDIFFNII